MAWFLVDDEAHAHEKFMRAGNAAIGAWTMMGSWCRRRRGDGFVPADVARRFAKPAELKQLVACGGEGNPGLLVKVDGGYRFHDWDAIYSRAAHQQSDLSQKRSLAGKRGAEARWQADGKADGKADGNLPSPPMATGSQRSWQPDGNGDGSLDPHPHPLPLSDQIQSEEERLLFVAITSRPQLAAMKDPAAMATQALGFMQSSGATCVQMCAAIDRAATKVGAEEAGTGQPLSGAAVARIVESKCRYAADWERQQRDRRPMPRSAPQGSTDAAAELARITAMTADLPKFVLKPRTP